MIRIVALLALCAASQVLSAAEGVLQISPACVEQGCFAGDAPGYPVEITRPGSYRLTANLDLTDRAPGSTSAIEVAVAGAGGVDLDLNGFAVMGAVVCEATPTFTCTEPTGSGRGILVSSQLVAVHDGTVSGFVSGVSCLGACMLDRLMVAHNLGSGIDAVNVASVITDSIAQFNGAQGIFANGRVHGSIAQSNRDEGLFVNAGLARDNVARNNGGDGILCIHCTLTDNLSNGNGGYGVRFLGQSAWGGNTVHGNGAGVTNGTAVSLRANSCGTTACP